MRRRMHIGLWIIWAIVWPVTLLTVYWNDKPYFGGTMHDVIAFLLLMFLISYFPIIVNDTPVFFIQGISLAVFLYYGLFIEIVLTQIAVIFLLVKLKVSMSDLHRVPVNLLMFLAVSVISGFVYNMLGGGHGTLDLTKPESLLLVFLYALIVFLSNHLFLWFVHVVIYKHKYSFFSKDMLWEGVTSLLIFPVGLLLYTLYTLMGTIAILFVGIPFVSLSLILKLYYSSQKMNSYLQKTSDIGHQLTEKMNVNEVMDFFISSVTSLLPVDYAYIIDVNDNKQMELARYYEEGKEVPLQQNQFRRNEGICNRVLRSRKGVLFSGRKEWRFLSKGFLPPGSESVIAVPVQRNQKIVGIVLLASKEKRAYEKYQLTIIDILSSYLGVAIDNARNYEATKAKSEKCALTKLYNYRYFEELLGESFEKLENGRYHTISLVMLDLDHFKAINDTYGHQSGNDVLVEVASRLLKVTGEIGVVARYGGEEFVVVLPNVNHEQCYVIAEKIRKTIANKAFLVDEQSNLTKQRVMIRMTASIGFATAPKDADDPMSLIRHADRAMYTGAKQKGRNKVAAYVQ